MQNSSARQLGTKHLQVKKSCYFSTNRTFEDAAYNIPVLCLKIALGNISAIQKNVEQASKFKRLSNRTLAPFKAQLKKVDYVGGM